MAVGRLVLVGSQYESLIERLGPLCRSGAPTEKAAKALRRELRRAAGKGGRLSGMAEILKSEAEMLIPLSEGLGMAENTLQRLILSCEEGERREREATLRLRALMDRRRGEIGTMR